ncbi:MAG: acetolactate synthase 3 large subunit [Rhodospirillales bacterium]|nr:acetolactate synthase 3 large subunit [Rhodospirillales bacterium]MDP6883374.1 acetolactate synthase 3 large subunit [Rhodospirillales bacterium]
MASKQLNGSQIVLKALVDQGVEDVFGYPGGAVLPLYDEIFKQNQLRHILVRQEGGAVHAAEGYARSTGKVGVVLVTSGPGATNAVTGLTDALMDSVPVVCLTGQVPTHLIGNDAFQEADTTGITRPCTKHNYLVKNINDLARVVHVAFHVARSGRPGPVVIDLPKDILMGQGPYTPRTGAGHKTYRPQVKGNTAQIKRAVSLMASAKRPLFYCGGGVVNSGPEASRLLKTLIRKTGYPCTLTLMGLGAYPATDKQFLGMVGMHGTYEANMAMHGCDLMINIGARFDDRVTGRLADFSPGSKKIHVDIDPSSINKNVPVDVPIVGDVAHVLKEMLALWKAERAKPDAPALKAWWRQIGKWQKRDCLRYKTNSKVIKPQQAIQRLYEATKGRDDVFVTTEVGQHQMWAAQFFKFDKPNHWLTSGGLGTMGYGLPAAMGVQVAHPKALVVDIAGEASTMMNIQEMSTIAQYRLPVKVFILNNQYMGMVRQWQELLHGSRYSETYMDALPDFVKLAEAFGAVGLRATRPSQLDGVIAEMLATDKAVIADIHVDKMENCFPMIPSGAAHNEMLFASDGEGSPVSEEGMVLV